MSGFTVRSLWLSCKEQLQTAGIENALPELDWLWQTVFRQDRHLMDFSAAVEKEQAETLQRLVDRRASREPLQYLIGSWPFMNFELAVAPGVLIPRSDTECVAQKAIEEAKRLYAAPRFQPLQILDLCAGSGALALALAVTLHRQVTAVELSGQAFPLLEQNIRTVTQAHHCPAVTAVQADVFLYQETLAPGSVGLIVSNPPYLTGQEMQQLQPEVRYEPAMALFGGQDGLDFYRHIAKNYRTAMAEGGALVFEIGAGQAEAVTEILRQNGWRAVELLQDEQGRDRCVSAIKQHF